MVAVTIKTFSGMKPIVHPLHLQSNEAQLAKNVRLISGAIAALRGTTTLKATTVVQPQTIYRFGSSGTETNYWFEFAGDVDVMRSPVIEDAWDRIYWTDGSAPKYGPSSLVLSGGSYPGGHYLLGVPAPSAAPSITNFTAIPEYTTVERVYVMTLYNPTSGKESSASGTVTVKAVDGFATTITMPTSNGGDAGVTKKRLYRKVGTTFRRVAEVDITEATYKDEATDASLGAAATLPTGVESRPNTPTVAPTATAETITVTASAISRQYVFTVKNIYYTTGSGDSLQEFYYAESGPSNAVSVMADDTQTVTVSGLATTGVIPSSGTTYRVYRKDANDTLYRFVGESTTSSFQDVIATTKNSTSLPPLAHDAPSTVKPSATPTASANTSTAVTGGVKRIYAVTFVDGSGNESGLSPASGVVEVLDGKTTVTIRHAETAPSGTTLRRLYRQTVTVTGGAITASDGNYKRVSEGPVGNTSFSDKIADINLGASLSTALAGLPPAPTGNLLASGKIPAAPVPEFRTYVYTLVSAYGEESAPSDASAVVELDPAKPVTVSLPAGAPTGAYNITLKRVYRSSRAANGQTAFQFVADVPVATSSYIDSVAQEDLGEVLMTENWDPPPSGLKGLRMMANGVAVGFVDNTVYFSEPNLPHAWPHKYAVEDEIVGIGTFGQTVVALTKSVPFMIEGIDPAAMTVRKLELRQSCSSKASIVETGDGVLYASPDGAVSIGAGGIDLVTKNLISRDQWLAYSPSTMKSYLHNGKYHIFFTDTTATRGLMVLDFTGQGAVMTVSDLSATTAVTAGYQDASTDTLYLAQGGSIVRFDAGTELTYTWKSKVYRLPHYANFSLAQVRAAAYPVTFKAYADGVLKITQTVTSDEFFRMPSGFKALNWEFEVSGTSEVTEINVCTSMSELMQT